MFKENPNTGQRSLNDAFFYLPKKLQEALKKTWAEFFYHNVFRKINEKRFSVLFSSIISRPNVPVNIIISLLFLKELNRWTDEDTISALYFDYRVQHAIGITDFQKERICINTLGNFRRRLYEHMEITGQDLLKDEVQSLTSNLTIVMGMNTSMARQDSLMISSNCKKMGRIELIYTVNNNLVKILPEDVELSENLKHYWEKDDKANTIYRLKKDETSEKIKELLEETKELLSIVPVELYETQEYLNAKRLLDEQTDENGPLNNKDISPESLQNPSEPDATYRKKRNKDHIGYVLNVVEARDQEKDVSMIIHHDQETNVTSDVELGDKALSSELEGVEKLASDGGFYSPENIEKGEERGIEQSYSAMTGRTVDEDKIGVDEFEIDEETNKVIECPGGQVPVISEYNSEKDVYNAKFDKSVCEGCPHKELCPIVEQVRFNSIRFDKKKLHAAVQRKLLGTEASKNMARFRAGVEGVPSVLRRRYGVDKIPVRGLSRSRVWIDCKIMMYNFKSFVEYSKRINSIKEKSGVLFSLLPLLLKKISKKTRPISWSTRKYAFDYQNCA